MSVNTPHQPVSDLQLSQLKVEWVERESVRPNKYNPNRMTWGDRMLLRQSILEDGWTQPIVTLPDRTIIDGEQRWTVAGLELYPKDIQEIIERMEKRQGVGHPESESILARLREAKARLEAAITAGLPATLASITGGLVPITVLDLGDDAHKIISTIRHNRARGIHQVDAMAGITQDLVQLGLDLDDLEVRLGMDDEEIRRFLKASEGQIADLNSTLTAMEFSPSVDVVNIAELDESAQIAFERSARANQAIKEHQLALAQREQEINRLKSAEIARREREQGAAVTQIEKEEIERELAKSMPVPPKPAPPVLKKLVLFMTPEEYRIVTMALGEQMAVALVEMCKAKLGVN